jgi:hypothetical protein
MAMTKTGVVDENTPQAEKPAGCVGHITHPVSPLTKESADKLEDDAAKRAADAVKNASTKK